MHGIARYSGERIYCGHFPMKTKLALVAALLLSPLQAIAESDLTHLAARVSLDPARVAQLLAEKSAPQARAPLQFAVSLATNWAEADGHWTTEGDQAVWRLAIHSAGAESLNLQLTDTVLPGGATLFLQAPDGRYRHGPYLQQSLHDGRLWTPIVPGEWAVLEARMPANARPDFELRVASAQHGFLDFSKPTLSKNHDPGLGQSGSCNVDVAADAGDPWGDQIRSVARIQIAGTGFCTGQLVNHTGGELRYNFLTADHCGIGTDDGDNGPASSVVFYWNLQNANCGGNAEQADLSQATTGASFLADDVESDFTLLQLSQIPPASYNVYLSGWDRGAATPANGVSIHHPAGDVKKISFYDLSDGRVDGVVIDEGRAVDTWRVRWRLGTTEPGSSGAGLWNGGRRLVGVLSGGLASCDSQAEPDFFGRFEEAWEANPDAAGQLRAHLDDSNTGLVAINGRNASATAVAKNACGVQTGGGGGSGGGGGGLQPGALILLWLLGRRWRAQRRN